MQKENKYGRKGWVKLPRKALDLWKIRNINAMYLYGYLLLTADMETGHADGSIRGLASKTGLSVQNVRTALAMLEREGMITRVVTQHLTHNLTQHLTQSQSAITICELGSCDTDYQECQHTNQHTFQHTNQHKSQKGFPPIPPFLKNIEEIKEDDLGDNARAQIIDELKVYNQWSESICKNNRITYEVFLAKVDEFSADMECSDTDITKINNIRAYFNKWLFNKKQDNGQKQTYIADPVARRNYERSQRLQAVAARAAALATESGQSKDVPY